MGVESENGWRPAQVGQDALVWKTVPGTNVSIQVLKGWPAILLPAFAADVNAYIEPLRDQDTACWTPTNSVPTSNHLNGTAIDVDWDSHPFHVVGTFGDKLPELEDLLTWYEDMIYWGGHWTDPIDEMHFQMGYDTWNNPAVQSFITRKIRSDGFSTYKRGVIQAQPKVDAVQILSDATGLSYDRAQEILPQVSKGLVNSECNTVNRIAFWLAQIGHESDDFNATEEYDKGDGGLTDRWKYLGRTWIQITWSSNYLHFSQWCYTKGLVPTSTYFVDNPEELAEQKWAGLGPAWYWTVARPAINSLCDANNFSQVTYLINGGYNGEDEREARRDKALQQGDKLLHLTSAATTLEGFLMALSDEDQQDLLDKTRQVWGALFNPIPSTSRYGDPKDLWPSKNFWQNDDGFLFDVITEHDASLGDPKALGRIQKAANGGDVIAQHFLDKLTNPAAIQQVLSDDSPSAINVPAPADSPPPNNVTCWQWGKHYPDALPNCPFCGATQTKPTPPVVVAPVSPATSVVPQILPQAARDDLPTVDKSVVDQLSLLQRFNHELPPEVSAAITQLIPVLKGLVK